MAVTSRVVMPFGRSEDGALVQLEPMEAPNSEAAQPGPGPGGLGEKQPFPGNVGVVLVRHAVRCAPGSMAPPAWRGGLDRLDRLTPPCPGFRSGELGDLHRVIAHFMDHHAPDAAAHGWTALDLFGVRWETGAAAVDSRGALMLPSRRIATFVPADAIAFGPFVHRRRSLPQAVLAWTFSAATSSGAAA